MTLGSSSTCMIAIWITRPLLQHMPRGPHVIQILRDFSILGSNIIDEIDSKINIKIYIPFVTLVMGGKIYSYISDIDLCDFYHILYFEKKNLLVQLMTPICDQSFKINRTEVNKLLKGSMNQ